MQRLLAGSVAVAVLCVLYVTWPGLGGGGERRETCPARLLDCCVVWVCVWWVYVELLLLAEKNVFFLWSNVQRHMTKECSQHHLRLLIDRGAAAVLFL